MHNERKLLRNANFARDRDRGLALSVIFAFVAKVASAATQLIAIPYGIQQLGVAEFASYVTLLSLSGLLCIPMINFGPRLVSESTDAEGRKSLFWAMLRFAGLNALVVVTIALIAIWGVGLEQYFPTLDSQLGSLRANRILMAAVFYNLILSLATIPEAFQSGEQKNFAQSIASISASTTSVALVLFTSTKSPYSEWLMFCLLGPNALGRIANSALFVWTFLSHDTLAKNLGSQKLDAKKAKSIVGSGINYSLTAVLAAYASNHLPLLLFSRNGTAETVVTLSALQTLLGLLVVPASLLVGPLIPALMISLRNADIAWVDRWLLRTAVATLAYAGCVCVIVATYGSKILSLWLGDLNVASMIYVLFASYFFCVFIEAVLFMFAHAFSDPSHYSKLCLSRIGLTLGGAIIASQLGSLQLFFLVAFLSTFYLSVALGYREIYRVLTNAKHRVLHNALKRVQFPIADSKQS